MGTCILDNIQSPADLKGLSLEEARQLAAEIRAHILGVVSGKGGHLGASLGAVELTIALHRVFDAPKDRLVWDTGHQAYPHKLLTGRLKAFSTLRQHGGISGFLSRGESPYDTFGAGHAGTAISAALGIVEARDHQQGKYHVIAIVGDGSLTAGMAYEALNHAGGLKRNLIVVLNDNEMSISKNVGAVSAYLNRMITGPLYTKVKNETESMIRHIPRIGTPVLNATKRAEGAMKGFLTAGAFFEEMGFRYIGPIDGHRLDHLLSTFENVKNLNGPLLVHVISRKGKGYAPAEANPGAFHGVSAFELSTGIAKKKSANPTYTAIFANCLISLATQNDRVVGITAAMPEGTGLHQFAKAFPSRFYDVGIAEQHAVTMAAGMAADGLRPVVAIYSTFLQRAYDQMIHDVALQNLPVVFCLDRAGLVGEDGPTHHGVFDIAYCKAIPNFIVMAPKDENELCRMLATALTCHHPVAIRYPRGEGIGVSLDDPPTALPIGKGEIVIEPSGAWDVVLFAIGSMVYPAQRVAIQLEREGISAAVVNARFIKPLDRALLNAVASRCNKIVTLEEHVLCGGFGESVIAALQEEGLQGVEVRRIGLPDHFIEHGAPAILREMHGLTAERISTAVLEFCREVLVLHR